MSATNRGAIRRESDFYRTPPEAINAFLDALDFMPFRYIIEPCAGNGALVRELAKRTKQPNTCITAIEIRAEEKENLKNAGAFRVEICDFLKWKNLCLPYSGAPLTIITNPPYSIAQEIIEHCFEIAQDAEVMMLLRQGFLSSKGRKPFWDKHPLTQLYPLAERPSFGASVKCKQCDWRRFYSPGEGYLRRCPECGSTVQISKTDACDYAWFVWSKYREPLIKVI